VKGLYTRRDWGAKRPTGGNIGPRGGTRCRQNLKPGLKNGLKNRVSGGGGVKSFINDRKKPNLVPMLGALEGGNRKDSKSTGLVQKY